MPLFLGIDGGGSHTRALLCDETGAARGRGEGGSANFHHAGWEGAVGAVCAAVSGARQAAGLANEPLGGIFLGLAAVASAETRERWTKHILEQRWVESAARIGVDHDIRIALAGGLAGAPGIALIAGTGSACYGRTAAGATWQAGGWGSIFDDVGGGYWLTVQAIIAAIRAEDGRGSATVLREQVLRGLGLANLREAVTRIHAGQLPRHELARFGPEVLAAAQRGDAAAIAIRTRGAEELALLAATVARKLFTRGEGAVVLCGSVARDPDYAQAIAGALHDECAGARIVEPVLSPVAGAALLALEQAGIAIDDAVIRNLAGAPS